MKRVEFSFSEMVKLLKENDVESVIVSNDVINKALYIKPMKFEQREEHLYMVYVRSDMDTIGSLFKKKFIDGLCYYNQMFFTIGRSRVHIHPVESIEQTINERSKFNIQEIYYDVLLEDYINSDITELECLYDNGDNVSNSDVINALSSAIKYSIPISKDGKTYSIISRKDFTSTEIKILADIIFNGGDIADNLEYAWDNRIVSIISLNLADFMEYKNIYDIFVEEVLTKREDWNTEKFLLAISLFDSYSIDEKLIVEHICELYSYYKYDINLTYESDRTITSFLIYADDIDKLPETYKARHRDMYEITELVLSFINKDHDVELDIEDKYIYIYSGFGKVSEIKNSLINLIEEQKINNHKSDIKKYLITYYKEGVLQNAKC